MNWLERLFHGHTPPASRRRSLHDLLATADHQIDAAWEVINQARVERGESPLEPRAAFRPSELIDPYREDRS